MEQAVLLTAEAIARRSHHGQLRADGNPYITHPAHVAHLLDSWGAPRHVVDAGWLHDTIEDCGVNRTELLDAGICSDTVRLVEVVTRPDDVPYAQFIATITDAGPDAIQLKVADIISNLSSPMPPSKARLVGRYHAALGVLLAAR